MGHSYHGMLNDRFVRFGSVPDEPDPLVSLVHNQFRATVLSDTYTCLGGAAAVRRGEYRLGFYPALSSPEAVIACAGDLIRFAAEFTLEDQPVAVFVAAFDGPVCMDEVDFEAALWKQLQGLHAIDLQRPDRQPGAVVLMDPADRGFIFAEREFFVVGLHPASSRWARRFVWPTLVFNALSHHVPLMRHGQYERMRDRIRARDERLQGAVSPYLGLPRLAQFAGRTVGPEWRCPIELDDGHHSGR